MTFGLEDIGAIDLAKIHELNSSEVPHVNFVSISDFERLSREAIYFKKVTEETHIVGFVMGFDQKASYNSLNYLWFKKKYQDFLYIDRIVVALSHRRRGVGRLLYQDAESVAMGRGLKWVTCEVNILPPNPESLRYHEALGFQAVGEQDTENGKKRVQLLAKAI